VGGKGYSRGERRHPSERRDGRRDDHRGRDYSGGGRCGQWAPGPHDGGRGRRGPRKPQWVERLEEEDSREQYVENLRRQLARADPEFADMQREKAFKDREKEHRATGQLLAEAMKSTFEDVLKDMRGMAEPPRGREFPPAPPDVRDRGGRGGQGSRDGPDGGRDSRNGAGSTTLSRSEFGWLRSLVGSDAEIKDSDSTETLVKGIQKAMKKKLFVGNISKMYKSAEVDIPKGPKTKAEGVLAIIRGQGI